MVAALDEELLEVVPPLAGTRVEDAEGAGEMKRVVVDAGGVSTEGVVTGVIEGTEVTSMVEDGKKLDAAGVESGGPS